MALVFEGEQVWLVEGNGGLEALGELVLHRKSADVPVFLLPVGDASLVGARRGVPPPEGRGVESRASQNYGFTLIYLVHLQ